MVADHSMHPPELTFVLPAFNEEVNIDEMTRQLHDAAGRTGLSYEILWINDGSTDGTYDKLEEWSRRDPRVRAIHFSRNFGHMAALTAGLEHSRASGAVICLDADGQHPPDLIPQMVDIWRSGADVVQSVRTSTADERAFKRLSSRLFYVVLNYLSDLDLAEGAADFRLLDRQVVNALVSLPERVRFIRGLVQWIGFRRVMLPYKARPRMGGEAKYNLTKMIRLGLSGITSFSIRPLRLAFVVGLVVLLLAATYGVYVLIAWLAGIELVKGWPSLLLTVLILGGIQLIMLGILSEYLARVYLEIKGRPVYVQRVRRDADGTSKSKEDASDGRREQAVREPEHKD